MAEKQKVLLVVMADVDPEHEEDLNGWYNEEHLPALLKVPGVSCPPIQDLARDREPGNIRDRPSSKVPHHLRA